MSEPRHVLVTGAAGRIGSAVVRHLRELGVAVTAFSNVERDDLESDRFVLGDAADEQALADVLAAHPSLPAVDGVVHMAALPHPGSGTPLEVYRTNVLTTFNVLTQAAEAGVGRAVFASSVNASGLPFNNHVVRPPYYPIDVHVPADLADWYSLSKASDELTGSMVARRWERTVVALRFPHTNDTQGTRWFSGLSTDDPAIGVNDGWSYIHVDDAARAVVASLTAELSGFHVFHVAARDSTTPYATEDLLDRYAPDVPRRRSFVGREPALDLTDARVILGFEAAYALDLEPRALPQELARQ
jgi:nucleoside-diphosphate-sugar epimerase